MEVPMLDEDEFAEAQRLYSNMFGSGKGTIEERAKPLLDFYEKLTGFEETNANAIMHHRISLYGPPCESCGKPYRTPKALFCAACGNKRPTSKTP